LTVDQPFGFSSDVKMGYKYQKKPIVNEEEKTFDQYLSERVKDKKQKDKKKKRKVGLSEDIE